MFIFFTVAALKSVEHVVRKAAEDELLKGEKLENIIENNSRQDAAGNSKQVQNLT